MCRWRMYCGIMISQGQSLFLLKSQPAAVRPLLAVRGKLCPEPFVRNQVQWLDFKGKLAGQQKEEETEMIYNYIDENMPKWARETVQKLVNKGYLKGNEKGELGLNDTMLKIFVVNDRAGLYGQ